MWQLYYFVLRLLSPAARVVFNVQHRMLTVRRTRVAITRPDGSVLLVKNSLGSRKWTLPGGGVERGESDEVAACREVREELGIAIKLETLKSLGSVQMDGYEAPIFIVCIDDSLAQSISPQKFEIKDWRWERFTSPGFPDKVQDIVHHTYALLSAGGRIDRMDDSHVMTDYRSDT